MERKDREQPAPSRGQKKLNKPATIPERQKVEQQGELIPASEEKFRRLFEAAQDGIFLLDARTGAITETNPFLEKMLGYTRAEMVGKKLWEIGAFKDLPASQKAFRDLKKKSLRYANLPLVTRDGRTCQVEFVSNVYVADGLKVIQCDLREITERLKTEEALKKSEDRSKRLSEVTFEGIIIHDGKKVIDVNSAVLGMFGYELSEVIGMKLLKFVAPDSRAAILTRLLKPGDEPIEAYGLKKDGTLFPLEILGRDMEVQGARLRVVSVRDFTDRKKAEEALLSERTLLRTLVDNLPDSVYIKDPAGRKTLTNLQDQLKMGATSEAEVLGKTDFDFYPPDLATAFHADDERVFQSGQPVLNHEEPITLPGGALGWQLTSKIPLYDSAGRVTGLVGIGHDITQRKQAELEIASRLADLEAINRISTALRKAKSLNEMLPILLDETLAIVGASVGELWLYDPSTGKLRSSISRGWLTRIKEKGLPFGQEIAELTIKTGELHTGDLLLEAQVDEAVMPLVPSGWGGICVPIKAEQETIGVLCVYVQQPRALGQENVRLLTTISEIAGNTIRRIRLFEETMQQVQRLAALRSMEVAISSILDLQIILEILLGHITKELAVDAADVLIIDMIAQTMEFKVGIGFHSGSITHTRPRLGNSFAGQAALERTRVFIPDIHGQGGDFAHLLLADEGFSSYIGVPLILKGQVKGVLEIFHRSPLNPSAEWLDFLDSLAGQAAIAIENSQMFESLKSSEYELMLAYDETIEGWSEALDLRDKETEGHSRRVTEMTLKLAAFLGGSPIEMQNIRRGALLHDIGKMGIPDEILRKPGPLTDEEWVTMRKHPLIAKELLTPIAYLHSAIEIPYCHHEKWDGTGYPRGLKEEQIPLSARIFAVVDVYDALMSDRPYRKSWSREKTLEYIQEQSGKHFTPRIVELFIKMITNIN